jgi:hypothetical protein
VETYYAVELGALVALGTADGVLALAGAELAEVFCCSGYDIFEEFKGDAAEGFTCMCQ